MHMKIKINSKVLIAVSILITISVCSGLVFAFMSGKPFLNGHPADSIVGLLDFINQAIGSLNKVYQVYVPAGCLTSGQYATGIGDIFNGVNGIRLYLICSNPLTP